MGINRTSGDGLPPAAVDSFRRCLLTKGAQKALATTSRASGMNVRPVMPADQPLPFFVDDGKIVKSAGKRWIGIGRLRLTQRKTCKGDGRERTYTEPGRNQLVRGRVGEKAARE